MPARAAHATMGAPRRGSRAAARRATRRPATARSAAYRRHLAIAVLAALVGVTVIAVNVRGGNAVSLGTFVGALFVLIALVRLRLARSG